MNSSSSPGGPARHPIKVVARRTGLTPDVIRAWEKRYQAVIPGRTKSGQRVYTDADVERLVLLARAVGMGRRIGEVAAFPTARLQELVREDEAALAAAPRVPGRVTVRDDSTAEFLRRSLDAVQGLDEHDLDRTLSAAAVVLTPLALRRKVLLPLLTTVGDRWQQGTLRVAHEHMASALVRSFLGTVRNGHNLPAHAPNLIVTTPAGQLHELGALMVASSASEAGWRVTYLGPNLPAEEIAAAARQKQSRAVALSVVYPADDPRLHEEFLKLRRFLGDDVAILVGGQASGAYAKVLEQIGALHVEDLDQLRRQLEAMGRDGR